jgi:hypothetical protein
MKSAKEHNQVHTGLCSVAYNERIAAITSSIRSNHYKKERVDQLKQVATNKGNVNKKENQLQQKTGVDRTLDMLGFIAYGKMKKATHHEALKVELVHREICSLQEATSDK